MFFKVILYQANMSADYIYVKLMWATIIAILLILIQPLLFARPHIIVSCYAHKRKWIWASRTSEQARGVPRGWRCVPPSDASQRRSTDEELAMVGDWRESHGGSDVQRFSRLSNSFFSTSSHTRCLGFPLKKGSGWIFFFVSCEVACRLRYSKGLRKSFICAVCGIPKVFGNPLFLSAAVFQR